MTSGINHFDPICQTFNLMSERIWTDLHDARKFKLNRGEETITDDFLLEIKRIHENEIFIVQFNKWQEARTGADWEWWLYDGHYWFGILIQAKVLNQKSNLYSSISHIVKGINKRQIDILIEESIRKGIPPLYFFYNYTNLSFPPLTWNCGSTPPQPNQIGCTIAHAEKVRAVNTRGGVGILKLAPVSMPLRCLVCCSVYGGPNGSLPVRARGVIERLASVPAISTAPSEGILLREEPPSYIKVILDTSPEDRPFVLKSLRSEIGDVQSIVVITQKKSDPLHDKEV